jgi:hypothetical protein
LRFNGGIRWWIMKGKGHKARKSTREGGALFGGSGYFNLWEREKVKGGTVLDCIWITGFIWVLFLLEDFHRGHLLLGILGSGARKP